MSHWILGLTGGIGSGKTTVANLFAELGIELIDADLVARELVQPGSPALSAIANQFGPRFLTETGELDRAGLRTYIFQNPVAKDWLNCFLHPLIQQEIRQRCAAAADPYAVLVAPLLLENHLDTLVNRVLTIDVSETTQIQRTCARDGNTESLVRQIMASQLSRSERQQRSDDLLLNENVDMMALRNEVKQLHQRYLTFASQQAS